MLFAALHIYWAVGGDAGLASSAGTDLAVRRPLWFVLLGLWGVALLLLAGAIFGVGMTRWRLNGRLRRGAVILGLLGAALLLARGLLLEVVLLTGVGGIASAVGPSQTRWSLILWNPWFVVGGIVLLLATRQMQGAGPQVRALTRSQH
ncbi:DUF3995 domain-containing protein [Actinophytocola sp.]|uniref:DUF3995 domain-containing protein n=1 Tax=Actinophytocola sp. TaxID=1872138 RepID=UPI002ED4FEFF